MARRRAECVSMSVQGRISRPRQVRNFIASDQSRDSPKHSLQRSQHAELDRRKYLDHTLSEKLSSQHKTTKSTDPKRRGRTTFPIISATDSWRLARCKCPVRTRWRDLASPRIRREAESAERDKSGTARKANGSQVTLFKRLASRVSRSGGQGIRTLNP